MRPAPPGSRRNERGLTRKRINGTEGQSKTPFEGFDEKKSGKTGRRTER